MKMTAMEREIAITLVEALVEYGLTDHLAQYGNKSTRDWFQTNDMSFMGFGSSGGATKVCIWHDDLLSWTIKVGYTEHVRFDYAAKEYVNYCLAEEAGLAHYFPATVYLGEFGGCRFYAQQWCECDENIVSSEWYSRIRDRFEEDGVDYDDDDIWNEIEYLDDFERVDLLFNDMELTDFLSENHIGDLHEGNYGRIGSRIVICDFSGYAG